jgi:caffeoyl-CoA O-methyltransferase
MRLLLALPLAVVFCLTAADGPRSEAEIQEHLRWMRQPGRGYANIQESEGRYLRDLVREHNVQRALEVGTSTGYSAIWIALALRETGGKLITIEIDEGRHQTAKENLRAVGLDGIVECRLGDALQEIPKVEGPLDMVFLDAVKEDYLKYLELALPKMRKGGLVVAHNVRSHPNQMRDFLQRIQTDPAFDTKIVTPGSAGFSVSVLR